MEEERASERAAPRETEAALTAKLQHATACMHDLERINEEVSEHGPFSRSL
jgi:hypothetical protein